MDQSTVHSRCSFQIILCYFYSPGLIVLQVNRNLILQASGAESIFLLEEWLSDTVFYFFISVPSHWAITKCRPEWEYQS